MAERKMTGIREKIMQDKIISIDSTERAQEQAEKFFEPQLVSIGLSEEDIESQENIEDLEKSLEHVNNAIQNFQSFGTLHFKIGNSNTTFETDILPILLERKRRILEGFREVKSVEKIENLRALIKKQANEKVQVEFEKGIAELDAERKEWKNKAEEVEKEKTKARLEKQNEQLIKLSSELYGRKVEFWRSLIERESAATIIGSILLILITFFLIAKAFFLEGPDDESLRILGNAFLIILGYFFGQTAAAMRREKSR